MKIAAFVMLALVSAASPLSAQAAPRIAKTLSGTELADLEVVRKAVWVDWFSGDTASLRKVLGPELVAITTGAPHWESLDESLASSAGFKANGGKLVSVSFDSTLTHRFGATVVMFSHYAVVMETGGKRQTLKGRATEVFVRSNGRWLHTSWHLDEVAS
jgi:SnoaL-like domain